MAAQPHRALLYATPRWRELPRRGKDDKQARWAFYLPARPPQFSRVKRVATVTRRLATEKEQAGNRYGAYAYNYVLSDVYNSLPRASLHARFGVTDSLTDARWQLANLIAHYYRRPATYAEDTGLIDINLLSPDEESEEKKRQEQEYTRQVLARQNPNYSPIEQGSQQ